MPAISWNLDGAVAQLGEHLLCKQGVAGSSPVSSTNEQEPERDGVRRVLTVLRAVIDGRALPDSDREFVSIFDIVDRKVWLAVGGVFSRRHGADRLHSKMNGVVTSKMPAVSDAESAE
jgi:hypothetical protein